MEGWYQWARESASPSLGAVAKRWQLSDEFMLKCFNTSGCRAILRADIIIAMFESK